MIRFLALTVLIAATVFIGLEMVDNGLNDAGEPSISEPELNEAENISPETGDSGDIGVFPSPDTTYMIGQWTVVIAPGERAGFDSNWTLQAGVESSNYSDRNRSIIYNCMRSYSLATSLNSM